MDQQSWSQSLRKPQTNQSASRVDRHQPIIIHNFDLLATSQSRPKRKAYLSTVNLHLSPVALGRQATPNTSLIPTHGGLVADVTNPDAQSPGKSQYVKEGQFWKDTAEMKPLRKKRVTFVDDVTRYPLQTIQSPVRDAIPHYSCSELVDSDARVDTIYSQQVTGQSKELSRQNDMIINSTHQSSDVPLENNQLTIHNVTESQDSIDKFQQPTNNTLETSCRNEDRNHNVHTDPPEQNVIDQKDICLQNELHAKYTLNDSPISSGRGQGSSTSCIPQPKTKYVLPVKRVLFSLTDEELPHLHIGDDDEQDDYTNNSDKWPGLDPRVWYEIANSDNTQTIDCKLRPHSPRREVSPVTIPGPYKNHRAGSALSKVNNVKNTSLCSPQFPNSRVTNNANKTVNEVNISGTLSDDNLTYGSKIVKLSFLRDEILHSTAQGPVQNHTEVLKNASNILSQDSPSVVDHFVVDNINGTWGTDKNNEELDDMSTEKKVHSNYKYNGRNDGFVKTSSSCQDIMGRAQLRSHSAVISDHLIKIYTPTGERRPHTHQAEPGKQPPSVFYFNETPVRLQRENSVPELHTGITPLLSKRHPGSSQPSRVKSSENITRFQEKERLLVSSGRVRQTLGTVEKNGGVRHRSMSASRSHVDISRDHRHRVNMADRYILKGDYSRKSERTLLNKRLERFVVSSTLCPRLSRVLERSKSQLT